MWTRRSFASGKDHANGYEADLCFVSTIFSRFYGNSPAIWCKKVAELCTSGKKHQLGTVIVQVVATIFSYKRHSDMCGGRHIVP